MPKNNSKHVLSISDLSFSYPGTTTPALNGVTLSLQENTINMIIGPNGSGKSTLSKLIIGSLDSKDAIKFYKNGKHISRKQAHLGYVPQKNVIDTTIPITVHELLRLTQKSCNRCSNHAGEEIENALKKVNANEYRFKKIGDLSGGQLQRVILARALLNHPQILILDEPEAGIDVSGERFFYEVLQELIQKEKLTVLIATHEMEVVSKYADQVICLNKSIVCAGSVKEALTPETFQKMYGLQSKPYHHHHVFEE